MKVVLVILSGDEQSARRLLEGRYHDPAIEFAPRALLETGGVRSRLAALRSLEPDVFAIVTESLDWQYGQEALMLFGALAGAAESIILDSRGAVRVGTRSSLLLASPFRIVGSYLKGWLGVRSARQKLATLEKTSHSTPIASASGSITVTYLRATPAPGTQPGGATSHINGVVKGLIASGAEVSFLSNDDIAGLDTNEVPFQRVAPNADIMPRAAFDITNGASFSATVCDLVTKAPTSFIYQRYVRFSYVGVEASVANGIPLFLEYNGSEVWIGKNWDRTERLDLLERYEMLNLNAATRIFVISEVEKNNLLARGIPSEKIIVNPNGVDTDEFRPGLGGDHERAALGIKDDEILAVFVGSFGPWHGVLTLADAIAKTPRETGIKFLMVGDGSLRPEVEKKLKESGDLDRVIFTGVMPHTRVPALLDACDILISPHVPFDDGSEFFGSPTKLFEYMAMGKGIVASRLGQIGDVLTDGETAVLVEPGNSAELSEAVQKLATDRELRERLGGEARRAAIERHTWKRNAERIIEAYRALATSNG